MVRRGSSRPRTCVGLIHSQARPGSELALAPVSFDQHPSPTSPHPTMGNPASAGPWWHFPFPRNPGVRATVPLLVSRYPDIIGSWCYAPRFDYRSGRCDLNHNIRGDCTKRKGTRENQTDQTFTQHILLLIPSGAKLTCTLSTLLPFAAPENPTDKKPRTTSNECAVAMSEGPILKNELRSRHPGDACRLSFVSEGLQSELPSGANAI
jgi:hypothetical protein